eukprot:6209630-Pleurochrysis_carterae.AAC.5
MSNAGVEVDSVTNRQLTYGSEYFGNFLSALLTMFQVPLSATDLSTPHSKECTLEEMWGCRIYSGFLEVYTYDSRIEGDDDAHDKRGCNDANPPENDCAPATHSTIKMRMPSDSVDVPLAKARACEMPCEGQRCVAGFYM